MGSSLLGWEFAFLPLLLVVPLVVWHARRHGHSWGVVLLRVAFCGWVAALAAVVLFPLPLPPYDLAAVIGTGDYRGWPYPWVSPVPLATILDSLGQGLAMPAWKFLVGNIAAFVPLGVLAPMLSRRWRTWPRALALGLGVSLAVELTQLALSLAMGFGWRVADVDDLLLNTLGTLTGFCLWRIGTRLLAGRRAGRLAQAGAGEGGG